MDMIKIDFYFVILIIASIADLIVPIAIATKYEGYSHFRDTISSLGTKISPVQKYQNLNLIIVGLLFVTFSAGQALSFHSLGIFHVLYILGILLFGVGTVMAGIFPEDPLESEETASGKIHGISSGIGFILLILNPSWAVWIEEFETLTTFNKLIFPLAVISFILFISSGKKKVGIFKHTGLFQRINLTVLYSHLIFNYMSMDKTV
jgi:hypothetical membrane protein